MLYALDDQGQRVESLYDLIEFNPYAVQYRYEAFDQVGDALDRPAAIARVGSVLRMIETFSGF